MEDSQICKECRETKRITDFFFRKDINRYMGRCKICHGKAKKRRKENRKTSLLKENGFGDCENFTRHRFLLLRHYVNITVLGGDPENQKLCSRCKSLKYFKDFTSSKDQLFKISSLCKECINKRRRDSRKQNPLKDRETSRIYRQKNKAHIKEREKAKRAIPHRNINGRISASIRDCLKRKGIRKNGRSWESILGYTKQNLRDHLEARFSEGMSWDVFDKIEIDHIFCKSSFAFSSIEDESFKVLWSLENLYPMWADDNLKKLDSHPKEYYGENYQTLLGLSNEFIEKVHNIYNSQLQSV